VQTLWQDLRYGLRVLAKSRGFAAVAVLTLALGIGANTALFSVLNGVVLNPLPYPHPDQIVSVASTFGKFGEGSISYPDYLDWARENHSFSSLAAYKSRVSFNLIGQAKPERLSAVKVSFQFLRDSRRQPNSRSQLHALRRPIGRSARRYPQWWLVEIQIRTFP
jgi:MacB-like periplasmic core domain